MTLGPQQQKLHDLLFGKGDVLIEDLYRALRGEPDGLSSAAMQRRISPYIVALNHKLAPAKMRVEPGALKQTYRLVIT